MKRVLFFVFCFLLAALALFAFLLARSLPPYASDFAPMRLAEQASSARLAFCVQPFSENQAGVLNLADLQTGHVSSIAPCDKLVSRLSWASTGDYLALDADDALWGPRGWVVDLERRSAEKIFMENRFGGFHQWTEDGRYAIFDHGDQYGNSETVVFDVLDWKIVIDSQTAPCAKTMKGTGKRGPAAVYPQDTLLLRDGTLIRLSPLARSQLIPQQYISRSVQTTPVSLEEIPPSSQQESVCGGVEKAPKGLSQLAEEISSLCWRLMKNCWPSAVKAR